MATRNTVSQENLEMLARYHRWAGERLLSDLESISDEEWYRDEGLFFDSIHGTLNHLLLVDQLWLGRLLGRPITISGLDQQLHEKRQPLIRALRAQWQAAIDYAKSADATEGIPETRFINTRGEEYQLPKVPIFQHIVNHGTHHRGQISAVLTRNGHPAPELDLGYMLYDEADEVVDKA